MTYTTQQLQSMSDFEVNKALFKKLGNQGAYQEGADGGLAFENWSIIDYCSNLNDIIPLLADRDISVNICNGWAHGYLEDGSIVEFSDAKKPYRAIACLLLIMED